MDWETYKSIGQVVWGISVSLTYLYLGASLVRNIYNGRKNKIQRILEGYPAERESIFSNTSDSKFFITKYESDDIIIHTVGVVVSGLVLGLVWPAVPFALIFWGIWAAASYLPDSESLVRRECRNNPEYLASVLEDKYHRHHDIAKEMETSGSIKVDLASATIEIEGKLYNIERKK